MKLLVVSSGGCACTAFIDFINQYIEVNDRDDNDYLKHNLPNSLLIAKYKPDRIIYIYGDADKTIRSLFRRNYALLQYNKLKGYASNTPFKSLSDYVKLVEKTNEEQMGLISNFNAWKGVSNVFFIHCDFIASSNKIDKYLDLPEGTCANFIVKERKTLIDNSIESENYLHIMNRFTEYLLLTNDKVVDFHVLKSRRTRRSKTSPLIETYVLLRSRTRRRRLRSKEAIISEWLKEAKIAETRVQAETGIREAIISLNSRYEKVAKEDGLVAYRESMALVREKAIIEAEALAATRESVAVAKETAFIEAEAAAKAAETKFRIEASAREILTSARETAAAVRESKTVCRETTIISREIATASRESEAAARETAIAARETAAAAREGLTTARETEAAIREIAIATRESVTNARETAITARETEAATRETAITARETEAATRETAITARETEAATRETAITARETEAATRETAITARETEAATREIAITARESEAINREQVTQARETTISTREALANFRETEAATKETAIVARNVLSTANEAISIKSEMGYNNSTVVEQSARDVELTAKEIELAAWESVIAERMIEIAAKESVLADRIIEIDAKESAIANKMIEIADNMIVVASGDSAIADNMIVVASGDSANKCQKMPFSANYPKLLILAPGGSSCSHFVNFIKKYVSVNSPYDDDRLMHNLPYSQEVKEYGATHIIYLYDDISTNIRSLFRKNTYFNQYIKLNFPKEFNSITSDNSSVIDNTIYNPPFTNLKEYVKLVETTNEEPMGILKHYNAWKAESNVFFIHSESINSSEKIDEYLELPKGSCSKFSLKERTTWYNNTIESENYLSIMKRFSEYLLLKNNILNNPTPGKCSNRVCNFLLHSDPTNNGGKHCCGQCKRTGTGHGIKCEKRPFTA